MVENPSQGFNFLHAIRNKTKVHLQVHPSCVESDCLGCSPPIVDLDDCSDKENLSLDKKISRGGATTIASSSISTHYEDSDHDHNDDSSTTGRVVTSIPLPISLQEDFARMLTFGNEEEDEASSKSIDDGGLPKIAPTSSFPIEQPGDLMTLSILHAPPHASRHEVSQHESGGRGGETDSSRSSVMRFDISHVLDNSPTKDQTQHNLLMEPIVPQFSPGEGCMEEFNSNSSMARYCDRSNQYRKKIDDDHGISPDRQEEDILSSSSPHQSNTRNAIIVIELLDTDDENFLPATRSSHRHEDEGGDLKDTSEDSSASLATRNTLRSTIDIEGSDGTRSCVGRSSSKASSRSSQVRSEVACHRRDISSKTDQLFRTHAIDEKGTSFKKNRAKLSAWYFQEFNTLAFEGKLARVNVEWSNKLRTTAGLTRLKRRQMDFTPGVAPLRVASIELSSKVLDDVERLRSTLLHEMVHAAAWIIDGVSKPAHGPCFRKWAAIAMRRVPSIEVTTTHDYQIQYKYAWACTSLDCGFMVQRHSRSVDIERQCCGRCHGRLMEVEVPDRSSLPLVKLTAPKARKTRSNRMASDYNLFVKEQSRRVRDRLAKQGLHDVSQAEVVKECAKLWQVQKQQETGIVVELKERT